MRADLHTGANGSKGERVIGLRPGSRKTMLVRLALELWRRGRLDLGELVETRGRPVRTERQALYYLARSSTADLEPLVAESLNGDRIVLEGPTGGLRGPERQLLQRLGVELPSPSDSNGEAPAGERGEKEPVRFIDMTPALLGLAAVVMALRYLALGMSDRELYVMAGIGYAAFVLIRTFSYRLRRPKNAPVPSAELDPRA